MNKILLCSFAFVLFVCPIFGQQQPVAFTNARIIPIVGAPIERGTVVVQNGKIIAIGAGVQAPSGATVIDATGKTIMPGLVDTHSHIGGGSGGDASSPIQPDVRILDGINAGAASIQRA